LTRGRNVADEVKLAARRCARVTAIVTENVGGTFASPNKAVGPTFAYEYLAFSPHENKRKKAAEPQA
jgi:hypothetical protein